jgi:hypothetical protein
MSTKVKKYIQNRQNFKAEKNPLAPEEILGELAAVEEMANVWAKFQDHLKTIEYSLLLDFCRTDTPFTKETFDAYRRGLESMNVFIEACWQAVYNRNHK